MKTFKRILLTMILIAPLTAFAHGEDVLTTLFIELIFIVIFIVGLLTINLNGKGKLIIGSIYILATLLTFSIINRLPYNEYRTMINIVTVVVPWIIVSLAYLGLKSKFPKERE